MTVFAPVSIYGSVKKGRLKKELIAGLRKDYCGVPICLNLGT
jgi:hypothetical protein